MNSRLAIALTAAFSLAAAGPARADSPGHTHPSNSSLGGAPSWWAPEPELYDPQHKPQRHRGITIDAGFVDLSL